MDSSTPDNPLQNAAICDYCKHQFVVPDLNQTPALPMNTLRSDYIPPDEQVLQTRKQLKKDEEVFSLYDEEITRLQTVLGKLVERKNLVEKRMKERRALVSAIRRLPNEILSEIFHSCVPPGVYSFSADRTGVRTRALDISQICSRWRTVINAIPKLWSSFHIDLYKIKHDVSSIIGIYIDRSQEHPLYVCLTDELYKAAEMNSFVRSKVEKRFGGRGLEGVDSLLGTVTRFEELKIDMSGGLIDCIIRRETPGIDKGVDFCRLKVLKTTLYAFLSNSLLWKGIYEAPKLTHLVAHRHVEHALLSLPHITSVDIFDIGSLDTLPRILHQIPSLERLTASFHICWCSSQDHPATITAKSLRRFSLDGLDARDIEWLFSMLVLPSMTSLEIVIPSRPATLYSIQPILDVLQRSSCSLQELVIRLPIRLLDLVKVIQSCLGLTYLEFLLPALPEAQEEITQFISQFGVHESMAVLAPVLSRLHIHSSDALSWDAKIAGQLVEALDSRARHSGLTAVQLSFYHVESPQSPHCQSISPRRSHINPAFRERIRELRVRGIDCAVEHQFYLFPEFSNGY
ncbi:hypothetical protein PQX77_015143 [Marasmius sp. AFHP31]|nr:hypothetical protein PQX77_015143 [Marasmius sp. AFHP31]